MTESHVTDVTTTLQERFEHFPGLTPKQAKFAQLIVLYEGRKTATKIAEECGKWCKAQDLMREIIIELN